MTTKRIHDIAKDLGIDSKVIVAKCQAEGISADVVKNHMSRVSAGLEASIREWFSSGSGGTAVETAERIAVESPKTKTARKRPAKSEGQGSGGEGDGEHGHEGDTHADQAVVKIVPDKASAPDKAPAHAVEPTMRMSGPPATEVAKASPVSVPAPHADSPADAPSARADGQVSTPLASPSVAASPIAPAGASGGAVGVSRASPTRVEVPVPPPVTVRPATRTPEQPSARIGDDTEPSEISQDRTGERGSGPNADRGVSVDRDTGEQADHTQRHAAERIEPSRAPADRDAGGRTSQGGDGALGGRPSVGSTTGVAAERQAPGHGPASGGGAATTGTSGGAGTTTERPGPGIRPAPMNVPTRPTVIAPAGPKLEIRTPVKISGPKVVRVEAPEQVEAPRPRRPGMGGPSGPGGPPGAPGRPRPPGAEDDGRGKRSSGGRPAVGAGNAAGKRSSGAGIPERRRAKASPDEWVGAPGSAVFSEQDLIEREARLMRSSGLLKKRRQDASKPGPAGAQGQQQATGAIRIAAPFTLKELSEVTGVKVADLSKKFFLMGMMIKINDGVDPIKAQEVMMEFDVELQVVESQTAEETVAAEFVDRKVVDERPRGPIVTILGHVDHGKTSLLDRIRNANVAAGEAGGITQKTSAFRVPLTIEGAEKEIVFLDTPGHEAFTSMRARGANITDVVVLVVSAPEGVMPQTIESMNHARAAKVPIVVALNKIDRPDATEAAINKTLRQLGDAGLSPVEWGGDTEIVRTSATTGQGIQQLLETLDYQAQLKELKADFGGAAQGTVIEARTEEGRGAVASILIQTGTLKVGDFIVMGRGFGRVRDISDDRGRRIREALPPMPVVVSGIDEVPDAGDKFYVVDSLKKAQEAAEHRHERERHAQLAQPKLTLDTLFSQMATTDVKEILIVLKAAEQGTLDVLKSQCEKIKNDEVRTKVIHAAIGGITESDVILAEASRAIVIGFNVIPSGKARTQAEQKGVEIRTYQVIYDITDDLKKAVEGLLAPEIREEVLGHAEVRKVFKVSKVGTIAGCYITDGTVQRDALIRVTRNGVVIEHDRVLEQLKRFKDDAKDVRAGMECGMKIVGYDDIKEGDVLECYKKVEVKRTL